jgi:predicted regulator of Ras-like GTPase activity (Roadblock/LC7/MglB family)
MLNAKLIKPVEDRLSKLLELCDVVDAVLVTTLDGHLCAMRQRQKNYPLERLATMGSTLMSLGDTMTAELEMGTCDNIISENRHGIVAFMHINQDFVLVSLTSRKNALGSLLRYSRNCAQDIAKIVTIN